MSDLRLFFFASLLFVGFFGGLSEGQGANEPSKDITGETGPIKVGILHSLRGTIAISESVLKDVILMMIDDLNRRGGLLGREIVPVVKDPQSNWPLFAEMARELIEKDKVAVVFGCWTSVSRKSVLSTFEELNSLLFYPVQYEGEECSPNVFYTGAAPNQQAIPAVDFLLKDGYQKFALIGTDYVYPRTTNIILEKYLKQFKGLPVSDVKTIFTPFGHSDWYNIIRDVKDFADQGMKETPPKKTAIVSTINGDANQYFYIELGKQVNASTLPSVAFSVGEREVMDFPADVKQKLAGHFASWNYFMSLSSAENDKFKAMWKNYTMATNSYPKNFVLNDPMEAHYIGFQMWANAVKQARTTNVNAVRQAMYGQTVNSPSGWPVQMNNNHHLSKPIYIGKFDGVQDFISVGNIVPQRAQEWSPYGDNSGFMCDWSYPFVCGKCVCRTGTYGFTSLRTYGQDLSPAELNKLCPLKNS